MFLHRGSRRSRRFLPGTAGGTDEEGAGGEGPPVPDRVYHEEQG